jgi:type IV pilus assembly protein PilA
MIRTTGIALLVVALSALVAGCGSDSKSSSASTTATVSAAAGQDAQAKSDARTLVSVLEACFADSGSYKPCKPNADGSVGGMPSGVKSPAAVAATTTDAGYTVTAKSESGNAFVLTKADSGTLERSCTSKGSGGCPASGAW